MGAAVQFNVTCSGALVGYYDTLSSNSTADTDGNKSVNKEAYATFDTDAMGIYNNTNLLEKEDNRTKAFKDRDDSYARSQNAIAMGINTYAVKKNSLAFKC